MPDDRITPRQPHVIPEYPPFPRSQPTAAPPPDDQQPAEADGSPRNYRGWLAAVAVFAVVFLVGFGIFNSRSNTSNESDAQPVATTTDQHPPGSSNAAPRSP